MFREGTSPAGEGNSLITIFVTASPCHPVNVVLAGPKRGVERRQESHGESLEGVETERRRYVLMVRVDG